MSPFTCATSRCEPKAVSSAVTVNATPNRLALGLIPTVAAVDIPDALNRFRDRYPQVQLNIRVDGSDELTEQVRQGRIEVAFLGLPTSARPVGVNARELARDRLVAVVAPDHPLAGEPAVDLARLSTETFIHRDHRRTHARRVPHLERCRTHPGGDRVPRPAGPAGPLTTRGIW